jgi:hypothetical protein
MEDSLGTKWLDNQSPAAMIAVRIFNKSGRNQRHGIGV